VAALARSIDARPNFSRHFTGRLAYRQWFYRSLM
jgi:hypothetical protein